MSGSHRVSHAGRALVALGLIALGLIALPGSAGAEPRWYGIAAGASALLDPAEQPGGWVAASAAIDLSAQPGPLLAARGTVAAAIGADSWAVTPVISGDLGVRLGRLDCFASGGVQIFGGARRADWTVFATFGLVGGGGMIVALSDGVRLGVVAQLTWLPSFSTAKISAPADESASPKPTFVFVSGGLLLEFLGDNRGAF